MENVCSLPAPLNDTTTKQPPSCVSYLLVCSGCPRLCPPWGLRAQPHRPLWSPILFPPPPRHYLEVGVPWPSCSRELVA